MSITAGTIITRVRDAVPDPTYDASGNALPNANGGLVRASSLYSFLDDAIKTLTQRTGWVVNDWYAFGAASSQAFYPLDAKWINIENAFKDAWRLARVDEQVLIWPSQVGAPKSLWFATHRVTDHWEITFFPTPTLTDPTTTLSVTAGPAVSVMTVGSTASWNTYGFMSVDNEIMWYGAFSNSGNISPIQRGMAGTTATTHNAGAPVSHLTLWVKGKRLPLTVATASDVVELPGNFLQPLQTYVLAKVRQLEHEWAEAGRLMKEFDEQCERINQDPNWRNSQGMQILAYGEPAYGPLAFGKIVVP